MSNEKASPWRRSSVTSAPPTRTLVAVDPGTVHWASNSTVAVTVFSVVTATAPELLSGSAAPPK